MYMPAEHPATALAATNRRHGMFMTCCGAAVPRFEMDSGRVIVVVESRGINCL